MKRSLPFCATMLLGLIAGCSSSEPTGTASVGPAALSDGGSPAADASSGGADASGACEGACRTTALTVSFGGKSESLTRAQFGFVRRDGASPLLHLEAHDGGDAACPTSKSPSPDRTLVVEDLPVPKEGATLATKDGVRAAFFDFAGTLLPSTPLAKATDVSLRVVAVELAAGAPTGFAIEASMTFPQGGTLTGHLFAEHCATMDE